MTTVIFGASAGVGRALSRALAAKGHRLFLLARDGRDLEAQARHLRTVYGTEVAWLAVDAAQPADVVQALETSLAGVSVRNLLFPVGMANDQDDGLLPAAALSALINANLVSVMAVTSCLLPRLLEGGGGNIVGFGSVAAIRGRGGANVAYAAAKRGLESYFESIRHRLAGTDVRVQFYRLGYVASQLTFGKQLPFPVVDPEWVAERIVKRLDRDTPTRHLPAFWAIVGALVKALPWRIYRRLRF
ncbi:MAG TPA: SDR family NAD(P)-dependent oxidoreductase [Aliidongia sp.]|nr:SDR family NAD(P)-dependent oxidoreductase [Aliidongia sp.]